MGFADITKNAFEKLICSLLESTFFSLMITLFLYFVHCLVFKKNTTFQIWALLPSLSERVVMHILSSKRKVHCVPFLDIRWQSLGSK
jgi:hypothetical protein